VSSPVDGGGSGELLEHGGERGGGEELVETKRKGKWRLEVVLTEGCR
jgi:hypothetical protein